MGRVAAIARLSTRGVVAVGVLFAIQACGPDARRAPGGLMERQQTDPAVSGNGAVLALIVDQRGRPTVQLRDLRSGQPLPLRHLNGQQPHSSPSLSWNGRYLAVITQRGNRRMALIEDRLTDVPIPFGLPAITIRLASASLPTHNGWPCRWLIEGAGAWRCWTSAACWSLTAQGAFA